MLTAPRPWMLLLSVAGLGVAGYLSLVHYAQGAVPLACSDSGLVNCDLVTSSAESMVGPLPVALLGLLFFVGLLALLTAERWQGDALLPRLELAYTAVGLLFVFYLVYSELFLIGSICLWCTSVHILTVALFLLALTRVLNPPHPAYELTEDDDDDAGADYADTEEPVHSGSY